MAASDSQTPIRVVLVISVRLYREGLAATLRTYPWLTMSTVSSAAEAANYIREQRPDVAVLDMSSAGAFDLIRDLQTEGAATRAIAFAIDEDVSTVVECARAGAAGYVTVNASVADLAEGIARAARGELLCTPKIAAALFRRVGELEARHPPDASSLDERPDGSELTGREREVLALLGSGLSNKAIATALNISEATVKNHVHHLLHKLRVDSRQQAAAHSLRADRQRPPRTSRNAASLIR